MMSNLWNKSWVEVSILKDNIQKNMHKRCDKKLNLEMKLDCQIFI